MLKVFKRIDAMNMISLFMFLSGSLGIITVLGIQVVSGIAPQRATEVITVTVICILSVVVSLVIHKREESKNDLTNS